MIVIVLIVTAERKLKSYTTAKIIRGNGRSEGICFPKRQLWPIQLVKATNLEFFCHD
jgi:hypothetical protein